MPEPETQQTIFEIESGIACLDFANTLTWRLSEKSHDWLDSFKNLLDWAILAGMIDPHETQNETIYRTKSEAELKYLLDRAIQLREAVYRIFSATTGKREAANADLQTLTDEMHEANKHQCVIHRGSRYLWDWVEGTALHDKILGTVARSAVEVLTSNQLERVGECQGEGCGWLFIDNSKNHSRRWCSMNDCGNRAKARKHYQAHKSQAR